MAVGGPRSPAENDADLCFIPLEGPRVERQLGLLAPRRQTLAPAAKALRECIIEELGVDPDTAEEDARQ